MEMESLSLGDLSLFLMVSKGTAWVTTPCWQFPAYGLSHTFYIWEGDMSSNMGLICAGVGSHFCSAGRLGNPARIAWDVDSALPNKHTIMLINFCKIDNAVLLLLGAVW